jgi:hypothetical protein
VPPVAEFPLDSVIERAAGVAQHVRMSKSKKPATGEGYLGEIMVHLTTRSVGTVENVVAGHAGWVPQITLKLPDGSVKKGKLSDFRDASASERKTITPAETSTPDKQG